MMGLWVTPVLNTRQTFLSKDKDLIEFSYKKFKVMYYKWKIKQQDKIKESYQQSLKEWGGN